MPPIPLDLDTQPTLVSSTFFTAAQLKLIASPAPLVFEIPKPNGIIETVVYTRSSSGLRPLANAQGPTFFNVIKPDLLGIGI